MMMQTFSSLTFSFIFVFVYTCCSVGSANI